MNLLIKNPCYLFWTLFFFSSLNAQSATPIICNQMYALCTSARCIPLPESPNDAICECVTEKGPSVGFTTCEKRKPTYNKYKALSLISTFSFAQFATKKSMNCPSGMPWANCVDMPCTVDPQNKKRALCQCKIDNTKAFFTFGGSCNTSTCSTGFWSGTTLKNAKILRRTLLQAIHLKYNKPAICNASLSDKDVK